MRQTCTEKEKQELLNVVCPTNKPPERKQSTSCFRKILDITITAVIDVTLFTVSLILFYVIRNCYTCLFIALIVSCIMSHYKKYMQVVTFASAITLLTHGFLIKNGSFSVQWTPANTNGNHIDTPA